jgi:hypothetical protein
VLHLVVGLAGELRRLRYDRHEEREAGRAPEDRACGAAGAPLG